MAGPTLACKAQFGKAYARGIINYVIGRVLWEPWLSVDEDDVVPVHQIDNDLQYTVVKLH